MRRRKEEAAQEPPAPTPIVFEAGDHTLTILRLNDGRWSLGVDSDPAVRTFASQAEAWEAGVRAVDELDRCATPVAGALEAPAAEVRPQPAPAELVEARAEPPLGIG